MPKVTQKKGAGLRQDRPLSPTFSARTFHSPDPLSSPHTLACLSLTSLCQSPELPSAHLSYPVESLPTPLLACLTQKMRGTEGGTAVWGPTAGPASKDFQRRHQLLVVPAQSCSSPAGHPMVAALGFPPTSSLLTQQLPACLCSRSPARSRWRRDQQVPRKLTSGWGRMEWGM